MKIVVILFEGLAGLLLLQSLAALAATIRLVLYAWRYPTRSSAGGRAYQPRAAIVVPCKGLDPEFEENLRPLFEQDYPDYELVFVTESEEDPAHAILTRMIRESSRPAWLIVAGPAKIRGQKVHNLCAAIETLDAIDRRTEVFVFADADARPGRDWLAEMVAPLGDKRVGATTGFRWFLPAVRTGSWKEEAARAIVVTILSIWNSAALALLGEWSRFAWGGSMAIRRENFDRLDIRRRWERALSDDYMLTGAIHEARQRIRFVPAALLPSAARMSWGELLEFTTRQIRITRIYSPSVWKVGFVSHAFFVLTFWGGASLLFLAGSGESRSLPTLLAILYLLASLTAWSRALLARRLLHRFKSRDGATRPPRLGWGEVLAQGALSPLVSLLYLCNFLRSRQTRRIVWRGIDYEMVSPSETIVRHRPAPAPSQEAPATLSQPRS
jgi:cellulose synthase/poly-beta-1,6-N-acetylglucosamine synthase-like glycosyltransferase